MTTQKINTYLLAAGHLASDINQGALAAILPFLMAAHAYDYATAATLVMMANLIGSVIQPVFGMLADRRNLPWTMALGLMLAGCGISATGFLDSFPFLCTAVAVSGIGVAMFHPQAALLVNRGADPGRRASAVSIFSFGGNIGFTLGPVMVTAALGVWGLKGTAVFIVPVLMETVLLLKNNGKLSSLAVHAKMSTGSPNEKEDWADFAKLCVVVFVRSIVFYGLNTFLVLYWMHVLGQSQKMGSFALTMYYALSAISTLAGGRFADRFGKKRLIVFCFSLIAPCVCLLALSRSSALAFAVLIPIGISIGASYSSLVVLGQTYLSRHQGFASGITLGLSVSIGGIVAPFLGKIGDMFGLSHVLLLLAAISIPAFLFSLLLPKEQGRA